MNNLEIMTAEDYKKRTEKSFKLLLLVSMVSMIMIFAGLTSAFVVSKSREDWLQNFQLPSAFFLSTALILLSSVTFQLAKKSVKKNDTNVASVYLLLTLLLGFFFIFFQFYGFEQIIDLGYYPTGSTSSITTTFLFVLAVVHLAHLLGGIISLLIIIYQNFRNKYNANNSLGIELGCMYWHFLDGIWVYLFLFLYFFK